MAGKRTRVRGELESEVMHVLWGHPRPMSAREVQAAFSGQVPAYTTVATALDRLHRKGQVDRIGESPRRILFRAARAEDEQVSLSMISALEATLDREAALLKFVGNLTSEDAELLRRAIGSNRFRPDRP